MTQQTRARKGGEYGQNGYFYHGGEFLPNTDLAPMGSRKAEPKARKCEVAPYTWEVAPTATARAIWAQVGTGLVYNRNTKTVSEFAKYTGNAQGWLGYTFAELAEMWNNGTRWVEAR